VGNATKEKLSVRQYLATVFDGMAKGLFASLIVGTILGQIGVSFNIPFLVDLGDIAKGLFYPCIGAGIAYARKSNFFTLLTTIVVGMILANGGPFLGEGANLLSLTYRPDPIGVTAVCLIGVEIGNFLEGKTKFDLILIPIVLVIVGYFAGRLIMPLTSNLTFQIGEGIKYFMEQQRILMGLLIGLSFGLIITSPISSAAVSLAILGASPLAAGAAVAGCCGQMTGFAVTSFRENKFGGLVAHGLGTSKLQLPNVIKNPFIWIPTTVASGVAGALSAVFRMETTAVGGGMGSCALVGQLQTVELMGFNPRTLLLILFVQFIIPAAVSLPIAEFMRKKGLIKLGDMKI